MNGSSLISLAVLCSLMGCESGSPDGEVAWSTKANSVLGKDLQKPVLKVYQSISENSSSRVIRDAAVEILLQAADSEDPLLRANAIEALHATPQYLAPILKHGLLDPNRGVRFVAAMTVGDLQMSEIAHLLSPLLEDGSLSVQSSAIYAMHRCGFEVDLTPLAGMLFTDDPEVRGNVAMILGKLGNPSAIPMLKKAAHQEMVRVDNARKRIVNLQIAQSMVKLGENSELEVIRAALFAPVDQGEIIALACQICGQLRDGQTLSNLLDLALRQGIRQQSAEIRMAAASAVSKIDPSRAPYEVPRAYLRSSLPTLRAQAAITLGLTHHPEVLATLGPMLSDSVPIVQIAAAGAILRNSAE